MDGVVPIQMTFPPLRRALDARLSLAHVSMEYSMYCMRSTHANEVLPTPGGPYTSVTCPRTRPPGGEAASALSSLTTPVLMGSWGALEPLRDCEAEMESTGTGMTSISGSGM